MEQTVYGHHNAANNHWLRDNCSDYNTDQIISTAFEVLRFEYVMKLPAMNGYI